MLASKFSVQGIDNMQTYKAEGSINERDTRNTEKQTIPHPT